MISVLFSLNLFGCHEKKIKFSEYCNLDPNQNLIKEDQDCDGALKDQDCNDNNPERQISYGDDFDCDGVSVDEDCNDYDSSVSELGMEIIFRDGDKEYREIFFYGKDDQLIFKKEGELTGDVWKKLDQSEIHYSCF